MSHGFLGIGKYGYATMAGFCAFLAYLGQSFKGPERPKYLLDRDLVEIAAKYQPALDPDHYDKSKHRSL
jgi:hypothetical protein